MRKGLRPLELVESTWLYHVRPISSRWRAPESLLWTEHSVEYYSVKASVLIVDARPAWIRLDG